MTLHCRHATQTARRAADRSRPVAEGSGSKWPHGNRVTAVVLLGEDWMLAMGASLLGRILYPVCDSGGHTCPRLDLPSRLVVWNRPGRVRRTLPGPKAAG